MLDPGCRRDDEQSGGRAAWRGQVTPA